MAHLNQDSNFQSWILTEKELIHGSALTGLQKQCIQNQICQLANQRLNIDFDPLNPLRFAQEEACLKGQIQALQYLLTLSAEAEKEITLGTTAVHINDPSAPSGNPQES